jgi:hypothetical protein
MINPILIKIVNKYNKNEKIIEKIFWIFRRLK